MATMLTVSAQDISLFHVAARIYGDATAWLAIAQANDISDPFLVGSAIKLVVPNYDLAYTGGAPQQ